MSKQATKTAGQLTVHLGELLPEIRSLAEEEGRSVNNWIKFNLGKVVQQRKNEETPSERRRRTPAAAVA